MNPTLVLLRAGVAVIATVCLALLGAACGGSRAGQVAQLGTATGKSSPGTSSSAAPAQRGGAVAFSACMRAHGVLKFPDPSPAGTLPKVDLHELGVSSSQFQRAQRTCQHLLPTTSVEDSVTECLSTGDCPGPLLHEILTEGLQYARCMRNHGVTDFPDPTRAPNGAPVFDLIPLAGTDWRSTQIEEKMNQCWYVYSPGIRVGLQRPGP